MSDLALRVTRPDKNFSIVLVAGLVMMELLVIVASLAFPFEVLFALIGVGFLYLLLQNTFWSLCLLILLHYFVIRGTQQITLPEIFFGFYFCLFLGTWFFRKIFLERQTILRDGLDYLLVLFLGFCFFSIIPALLFGSSELKWLRELAPYLALLLIFPIREQANSKKRIQILMACFLLLGLAIAIDNLFSYQQAITRALEFWQIAASRKTANTVLVMAIIIVASAFFAMTKSMPIRWGLLLVVAIFGTALIITFSRGFWVATMIGAGTAFSLLSGEARRRMVIYAGTSILLFAVVLHLFLGDLAAFFLNAVEQRFQSVGDAAQDLSLANRFVEAQAVWDQIKFNPIAGYGLGKTYFFEPLIPYELPTAYVHNTVLYLWLKVGILGAICLGAFIGGIFLRGAAALKNAGDTFSQTLLAGLIACLVSMIVITPSSPQFIDKDSMLAGALICGLVQALWQKQLVSKKLVV